MTEAYRAKNGERLNKRLIERRRADRLGMTLDEYLALDEDPGRACSVCGSPPDGRRNGVFRNDRAKATRTKRLAIDHCHTTGRLRGFLCGNCNSALGFADDDPELLRKMADYLESGAVLAVPLDRRPPINAARIPLTCSAEDCPNLSEVRGLCAKHYARLRRNGKVELDAKDCRVCSIEGCENSHYGHDLCRPHLRRLQAHGDPLAGPPVAPSKYRLNRA